MGILWVRIPSLFTVPSFSVGVDTANSVVLIRGVVICY